MAQNRRKPTGVNAPMTHWGRTEIWSLKPHSEVVWAICGHILLVVWMHVFWTTLSPPIRLTSFSWAKARMPYSVINNNNRQQEQQQPTILVDGVNTKLTVWFQSVQRKLDDSHHNRRFMRTFGQKTERNGYSQSWQQCRRKIRHLKCFQKSQGLKQVQ